MFTNLGPATPATVSVTGLTGTFGADGSYLITGKSLESPPSIIDYIQLQTGTPPVTLELHGQVRSLGEDTYEGKITRVSYDSDGLDFDIRGSVHLQDLEDGRVKFKVSSFSLDIDGPVDAALSFQGALNVHNGRVSGNISAAALEVDGGYIQATALHRPATHLDIQDASTLLSSFLSGNDTIYGEGTDQTLRGYRGNDTINAGSGNDILGGDRGNDTLRGNDGDDVLNGSTGNDRLFGGGGNDTLNGDNGNDTLHGGDDDDTLNGGAGHDKLDGGLGNDTLSWDAADSQVNGGEGTDFLLFAGADLILDLAGPAGNRITNIEALDLTGTGDNTLVLAAADVMRISETDMLTVTGDSGDEIELSDAGWTAGADSVIDAQTYHSYTNESATLLVLEDVSVVFLV